MRWIIFAGIRSARHGGGQRTEWQPLTKLVWLVFAFGIPIAIGGTPRVIAIGVAVFVALVVAIGVGCAVSPRRESVVNHTEDDMLAEYIGEREGAER